MRDSVFYHENFALARDIPIRVCEVPLAELCGKTAALPPEI